MLVLGLVLDQADAFWRRRRRRSTQTPTRLLPPSDVWHKTIDNVYNTMFSTYMAWCPEAILRDWSAEWARNTVKLKVLRIVDDHRRKGRAFVAVPQSNPDRFIVSFRGVVGGRFWESLRVWKSDFYGTRVHNGFLSNYKRLEPGVVAGLREGMRLYPNVRNVQFQGFSMGGALAALALVDIRHKFPDLCGSIVSFGAPRVGNVKFAEDLFPKMLCGKSERYTHRGDIVVHVPPRRFGFRHHGGEVWNPDVSHGRSEYALIRNCDTMDKPDADRCSNRWRRRSVKDHLHYLGVEFDKSRGCFMADQSIADSGLVLQSEDPEEELRDALGDDGARGLEMLASSDANGNDNDNSSEEEGPTTPREEPQLQNKAKLLSEGSHRFMA